MKIEEGKYYKTRHGTKVGPLVWDDHDGGSYYPWLCRETGFNWTADGMYWADGSFSDHDLIAEWTGAPDDPTDALTDYAALAAQHGILITLRVGEMSVVYDGRDV